MSRKHHRRRLQIVPQASNQPADTKRLSWVVRCGIGALFIMVAAMFVCLTQTQRSLSSPLNAIIDDHYDPLMRSRPRYVKLFSQISPAAVRDDLRPVHLYKDDRWHCSGIALRWSATSEVILTSLHGFGTDSGAGTYTYRVMSPFDPTEHPIA